MPAIALLKDHKVLQDFNVQIEELIAKAKVEFENTLESKNLLWRQLETEAAALGLLPEGYNKETWKLRLDTDQGVLYAEKKDSGDSLADLLKNLPFS